jgi:prepilin-type N-terminal cleavage/methylation domain-containing protein
MDKRKSRGFSLLELLIVVAIILIIATIAIPSLLRSRQAANESGAVSTLRTIVTAQITYMSSNGGNFGTLPQLSLGAGLLDDRFGTDISPVGGFNYEVNDGVDPMPTDFRVDAIPISAATARFDYYVMPDGVVRFGADTLGNNPQPEGTPVQ